MNQFDQLPDQARLYVFGASRPVTPTERDILLGAVDEFLGVWQAHKADVVAARDWRHDRFLLVGADEEVTALSGCSIDSLTRRIKELELQLGCSLIDGGAVFYRGTNGIERVSREVFARRVAQGDVGPGTIVFNNTVTTVGHVRADNWEIPFERSWHAQLFPTPGLTEAGK
ncbi:MAG: hypothetical protein SGI90_14520 [Candidatus Eisenbacteria bacterium]|nr:hypothetical protein [Candidatus Eisenbacteria bacterium]